jgi:Zn-dependent peptidase ImmA (M78 family)
VTHLSTLVEIAAELRRKAKQTKAPYSTSKIVSTCFPDALVTGYRLPPKVDEIVSSCSEGPTILYSRALPGCEQRYAIAHALAHLMFDKRRACMRVGVAGLPKHELRADFFGAEVIAPLSDIREMVSVGPSKDPEDHEIYLDQVDQIASHFNAPPRVIHAQIRRIGTSVKSSRLNCLTNW